MNFHLLIFCVFFLFPALSRAQQNLVRNPSFEFDTIAPPIDELNWRRYRYWMSDHASEAANPKIVLTQHWYQPTQGTTDYYNSYKSSHVGFSTKNARTGKGRIGIIAGVCHNSLASWLIYQNGYSEYVSTRLTQPLEAGKTYCVRYYVAHDRKSNFAAARLGALLTRDSILMPEYSRQIWQQQPQVMNDSNRYITSNMGWVMICDTFIARGGEEFLTLGNFDFYRPKHIRKINKKMRGGIRWSPMDKFSYYYIDDVSVTEVPDEAPVCAVGRDTVARNNLLLIVDLVKDESAVISLQTAVHELAQTINHRDMISIVVRSGNAGMVLLENCPADSLGLLSAALSQIRPNESVTKDYSPKLGYEAFLKKYLRDGNNHAVLITNRGFVYDKRNSRQIEDAAYYQGVKFSVIQLAGSATDSKMKKLSRETDGKVLTVEEKNLADELGKLAPREQQDTKYSGKKNYVIASWIFLSKVVPVLMVVIYLGLR
ncbi:MAG: hypothetical protein MUC87_07260 [Bacteroidia bacterium]|nr:hypothetical protein [Bacteroidia bacterium]